MCEDCGWQEVTDIYADDIGAVQVLDGGNVRLVYMVGKGSHRHAVAAVILPMCNIGAHGKVRDMLHKESERRAH